jgi:hypothetical protein
MATIYDGKESEVMSLLLSRLRQATSTRIRIEIINEVFGFCFGRTASIQPAFQNAAAQVWSHFFVISQLFLLNNPSKGMRKMDICYFSFIFY